MTRRACLAAATAAAALLGACASAPPPARPLALAPQVDVPRFMGDWYVIASIPTFFEKGAHDALEQYRLDPDGSIDTVFSFRAGSFDGPERRFHSRGFVRGGNGAIWGQRYVWPIEADYRVMYVAPDYSATVIGREKRDYVWILARTPRLPEAEYARLAKLIGEQGYDTALLAKVPQSAR